MPLVLAPPVSGVEGEPGSDAETEEHECSHGQERSYSESADHLGPLPSNAGTFDFSFLP
jgi:hypothetical protein